MSTDSRHTPFVAYLRRHDPDDWGDVLSAILPDVHEVDRDATRIWFRFFPLELARAFRLSDDPASLEEDLVIQGDPHLEDQIDTSHRFLYGHRYWPAVKERIEVLADSDRAPASLELTELIREVAREVAADGDVDESLTLGIAATGFMTLQQAGLAAFEAAPGTVEPPSGRARKSPEKILKERRRDRSQGLFGFLKGVNKEYLVHFDERRPDARFELINGQHVTTAAKRNLPNYPDADPRCKHDEGPIPVQCRSAACGTCWVGILGGAEKLSEVKPLERRRIRYFGYIDSDEPRPLIRLACQAKAYGNATIVIPPWNGIFGKYLAEREEDEESAARSPKEG